MIGEWVLVFVRIRICRIVLILRGLKVSEWTRSFVAYGECHTAFIPLIC